MAKFENQKLKILYVAKFFLENSDEKHAVSAGDIIDYLREECSIESERRSIYRDIAALRDVLGMDIDSEPGGRYRLMSRQFEFDDLHIIAECIHAAKFISASKAKELVEMISELGSIYQADYLNQEVYLIDRVKTTQKGTLNIISTIFSAMPSKIRNRELFRFGKKIQFKYLKHSLDDLDSMIERHDGKQYVVSPFRLIINDGYYYLLAYDEAAKDMRTYRVDRLKDVKVLDERGSRPPEFHQLDLNNYTKRVFSMFSGERQNVTMQFENTLLDAVIDRFGTKGLSYHKVDEEHFAVSTEVEVSNQFYSWLLQFGEKAKIIFPKEVADGMKDFLSNVLKLY